MSRFAGFFWFLSSVVFAQSTTPVYLDPHQPVEVRVRDLLGRMTLEEKIGQINMPCVYVNELGKDNATKIESCRRFAEGTREKGVGPGGGYFTSGSSISRSTRKLSPSLGLR